MRSPPLATTSRAKPTASAAERNGAPACRPMPRSVAPGSPISSSSRRTACSVPESACPRGQPPHRLQERTTAALCGCPGPARWRALRDVRAGDESVSHRAILLPGIVSPAKLRLPAAARGSRRRSRAPRQGARGLRRREAASGLRLGDRLAGILREADSARFERVSTSSATPAGARSRRRSRPLPRPALQPLPARARLGRKPAPQRAPELRVQKRVRARLATAGGSADAALRRAQLAPASSRLLPGRPDPPWMASRPAGIQRSPRPSPITADLEALGTFPEPVYYALGGRTTPTTTG